MSDRDLFSDDMELPEGADGSIPMDTPVEETPNELEDGEEVEEVTIAQILAEMQCAWVNELASPALLPHRFDLIVELQSVIDKTTNEVNKIENKQKLGLCLHRLEMHRVSYMINDYLRTRLKKIEKNPRGVLKEHERKARDEGRELLAEKEKEFTEKFGLAESTLIVKSLFSKIPVPLRKFPIPVMDYANERCFAQVVEDGCEDVSVGDMVDPSQEVIISLPQDTVHLIPFNAIREHLENEKIRLL